LLDDILSEFDEVRTERVLDLTQQLGQTFITSTSEHFFAERNHKSTTKRFYIKGGTIAREDIPHHVG
jgi:recombinational DNA repair ATPase RecF